eukprot:TRINITY_DN571_c0_g2_i5.p1 TRINITY_DN571_c0_g2~~TRINITY_DN571_c0_g2_i5.p1  ORF type:complete len:248 (-),score=48.86 TRINITY_DN571_c0_g2_i5:183-926(-)
MSLRSHFPDLSVSVVQAVEAQVKDKTSALKVLRGLTEPSAREQERMLEELREYKFLGRETILGVLRDCEWDVEKAIVVLLGLVYPSNTVNDAVCEVIAQTDQKEIREILIQNDGDTEAASEMLLKKQVDGLSPQERKQRERREILNAISCRFPQFTEEICFTVLSDAHWMIPDAIQILLRMNRKRRINLLKQDYPDLSESVIRSALVPSDPENLQTREKLDKFIADQISTEEKDSVSSGSFFFFKTT